ncbi:MAG: class I SAM-dependent methyltransferase [Hydrogenophaga sp.]|uniref:class I SAM-dependent methyltransferase n=1 Tax=Hydrogenophaga sp. TaxID=1904254 RepID=UPI0025B96885|nr:class I SAM-dependent methyltransferase [Hydrogenophaga sp.]MBT9549930.1 class I SAM-dependent methyltransferase [Hydrogenophaga sp.]
MSLFDLLPLSSKTREMRRVFGAIHSGNSWGDCESSSGPGSTRERASQFLPDLIALVQSLGTRCLLDVPCGDFNWAAPLADAVDRYVGVDVVPALVSANETRWSSPRRQFLCRDMVRQRLPDADLVLSRDALVHLCEEDVMRAIANLRRTGARYLVATTFVGDRSNEDIPTGAWRPLNLQRPPFGFPAPIALIDERCHHTGGIYSDKHLGVWRFEDLPAFRA